MNNYEIDDILKRASGKSLFYRGVYSSDNLPKRKIVRLPMALVANLSPSSSIGTHWISIFINKNRIGHYFDSYGLPPVQEDIVKFLHRNCRKIKYNYTQLQSTNSSVCGAYVICYIIYTMKNQDSQKQFKDLFSKNTFINDYCIQKMLIKIKHNLLA